MTVLLSNGTRFERPEERIREYCEVEVYRDRNYAGGYDDRHNVNDSIAREDLESANNLYAGIRRIDFRKILVDPEIPQRLSALRDEKLEATTDEEWGSTRELIRPLVSAFLSMHAIDLAKTMKILHLKRPHLLPVLDSYVVKFVTGNDVEVNRFSKGELLQIGLDALDIVRADLIKNRSAFEVLQARLVDLPAPLTVVRLYGILCWTQEKWVNRKNPSSKYGTAVRSLDQSPREAEAPPVEGVGAEKQPPEGEITSIREFRRVVGRAEGVIVITGTKPPRAHSPLCDLLSDDRFNQNVSMGEGKGGKYYWRNSLIDARKEFGAVGCKRCRP